MNRDSTVCDPDTVQPSTDLNAQLTSDPVVPQARAADPPRSRSRARAAIGRLTETAYVLPVVFLVAVVILWPGLSALYHSFFNWQPGYASPWVGLTNYRLLLSSPTFHQILVNQGVFLLGIPLWTIVPLMIALVLYEGAAGAGVFRTIFFFPAVLSPAIVGILFRTVLADDGLVNEVLRSVGLGSLAQQWLESASLVKPTLIVVLLWASGGIGIVIFSAALSALPVEVLEAAQVDGAGWIQRLRYIVLPMLTPTIGLWVVFQVVTVFTAIFAWIYVLTSGGPGYSSTTIDYDIYENALKNGFFGEAAAESAILLAIVAAVAAVAYLIRRRRPSAVTAE